MLFFLPITAEKIPDWEVNPNQDYDANDPGGKMGAEQFNIFLPGGIPEYFQNSTHNQRAGQAVPEQLFNRIFGAYAYELKNCAEQCHKETDDHVQPIPLAKGHNSKVKNIIHSKNIFKRF